MNLRCRRHNCGIFGSHVAPPEFKIRHSVQCAKFSYQRPPDRVLNGSDTAARLGQSGRRSGALTAMTATTTSKIVWPSAVLAGCIFCMIVRDTRGVALAASQRFNFFPASPLCCVTWVLAGEIQLITRPGEMDRPWSALKLPDVIFSGAQPGPLVSWNPGETYAITIAFYPDAFAALTGLDLSAFTGRMIAADDVLPGAMGNLCREFVAVVERDGLEEGYARFERSIAEAWSSVRPDGNQPMRRLKDWTSSLVLRAAFSGPGRSTRQIARRVKAWTGLSARELHGLGHSEKLYANIHEAIEKGHIDWAELAAASGFADQGHMIRRMRQHTGFTPEQLRRVTPSDESLWGYRLLGQYFSKPKHE